MVDDRFKIYIERLRDGQVENIDEQFSSDFLPTEDYGVSFSLPVNFTVQAYLVGDKLLLHISVRTDATLPCKICNEPIPIPIEVEDFYVDVPLEEIGTGIYDYQEKLREAILLEIPDFVECNDGDCPERKNISKFLKKDGAGENEYQPFKDLHLD